MRLGKLIFAVVMVALLSACGSDSSSSDDSENSGESTNNAPTVNAGADKSIKVNESITVTGTANDSDGSIVAYEWKEGSKFLANTAIFNYLPTVAGTDTLTLTVTDDDGATASDSVVVTVTGDVVSTLSSGLVAHYEFEGNANDSSGNGNHGIEYGGVGYSDGVIGKAGDFDGVDDRIKISGNTLNGLNLFTINIMLKLSDNGSVKHFISGANSNQDNEFLIRHDNGSILIYYKGISHRMSNTTINDNSWHSLILVKFSTNFKLYIDSNFDSEWEVNSTNNLDINDNGLWIGTDQDCVGGCFENNQHLLGKMDDFRIYNRVLNESEIQELYNLQQ